MRIVSLFSLAAILQLAACSQSPKPVTPETDEDKTLHAVGVILSREMGLERFAFTDAELELVKAGLVDGARDPDTIKPEELQEIGPRINALLQARMTAAMEKVKKEGEEFIAKAAAEDGAVKTPSGVVYKSVKDGDGATPAASDTVRVNYEGRLVNGKVFDSSAEHEGPVDFHVSGVIPCWTEAVQMMKVGGSARVVCPSDQAYGDMGQPGAIPGGATLDFDVELLEIVKPDAAGQ